MTRAGSGWKMHWLTPILTLIASAALVPPPPVAAGNPVSVLISNVRDTSFVVSWLTPLDEAGQVQLVDGPVFQDDRGADFKGKTHYITVSALVANSRYQFDILSGGGRYDNERAHYAVVTGITLVPPLPDLVVGRVRNPDGTNAVDAMVIFSIQQEQRVSAPLSMVLTPRDGGFFHINLSGARMQSDLTRYFSYGSQTGLLTIQAVSGRGLGSVRLPVGDTRLRAPNPNQTIVIDLSSGALTPTLVERLPTPAPIPSAPPQETEGLVVGVGVAALVFIGILVTAMLYVWQK